MDELCQHSFLFKKQTLRRHDTKHEHMDTKPDQSQFMASKLFHFIVPSCCRWLLLSFLLLAAQPLHLISTIAAFVWVRWVSHLSQWPVVSQPRWKDASLCAARCWLICVPVCSPSLTHFCILLSVASFSSLRSEQQRRSMTAADGAAAVNIRQQVQEMAFQKPLQFGLFVETRTVALPTMLTEQLAWQVNTNAE